MRKGLFVLAMLLLPAMAFAWTLYWTPVTTWTDNTAIESQHLPMSYVVEWDGAVQSPIEATTWAIPSPSVGHGISHTARIKAVTTTGIESVFSPPFSLELASGSGPGRRWYWRPSVEMLDMIWGNPSE